MSGAHPGTDLFNLAGRVAAVVGGAGVLGSGFCRGLADAGASVAVLDLSAERAEEVARDLRTRGTHAVGMAIDATDRGQVDNRCADILAEFGAVDVLINAVGVNSATPFFDVTESEWERIIAINLTSAFHTCQRFGKVMVESGRGGSIINISSTASGPPLSQVFTYGITKAGVNNLTQYLAREFAPAGVRVNAILPGFFPAEQNRQILSTERVDAIVAHTPMGRLGSPDELIGTVIWLASERASGFVTGALVRVDGGFHAMTI
jgi:NAD(P)-dependent dehydrogenase (short-subunit alcohol dehydrogenase family)